MRHKLFLLVFLMVGLAALTAQQADRYVFYENFEGLIYPPSNWTMNSVERVSIPTYPSHGGNYCVRMNANTDYMITPMLQNLNSINYWHLRYLTAYQFKVSYSYNLVDWTDFPGYPMYAGTNWTMVTLDMSGLNNVYVRWMPVATAGSQSILFDDIEFNYEEPQVPVVLSAFTASFSQQLNNVTLTWVTQSESETAGYNVFRSEVPQITQALQINQGMIEATNTSTTHTYNVVDGEVNVGTWYYWLQSNDLGGFSEYFGPISITITDNNVNPSVAVPFNLYGLGPNPFNPSSATYSGSYGLAKEEFVNVVIYNVKGQKVRTLISEKQYAGYHNEISWDGRDDIGKLVTNGMYYLTMNTEGYSTTRKIAVIK